MWKLVASEGTGREKAADLERPETWLRIEVRGKRGWRLEITEYGSIER